MEHDPEETLPERKRHLHLIVDNDPTYHGRSALKKQKEQEKKKIIASLEKEEKKNTSQKETQKEDTIPDRISRVCTIPYLRRVPWNKIGVLGVAATAGFLVGSYLQILSETKPLYQKTPQELILLPDKDFNYDGIPDAYIKLEGGYKIPLYGTWVLNGTDRSITYVTEEEMKKRFPNSTTDYKRIEDILNKP